MSVFDEYKADLERHEFMMGIERGRLAVALDLLTDSLILVGQHGVYCTSSRNPNKPAPPHIWGAGTVIKANDGFPEQRLWKCANCELHKITLLPQGTRAWRQGEAGEMFTGEAPECRASAETAAP